jgi:aspartyl aminopeptidase
MKDIFEFLNESKSSFHVVMQVKEMLEDQGFVQIYEYDADNFIPGGRYYVVREDSSLIAFCIPKGEAKGFLISASHSDIPSFRIKNNPEIKENGYLKLNTEKYGGMIMSTWFDRPLSVAGRVIVSTEKGLSIKIIDVDKDLLVIPSLAIHMNRKVNDGIKYDPQVDLLPLAGQEGSLQDMIAKEAGVQASQIVNMDLTLYNREKATSFGINEEFIGSAGLDDRQCVYGTVGGFLKAENTERVNVLCILDSEEIGSGTRQGASSTFLSDWIARIANQLGVDVKRTMAGSFLVSADNAHAIHPNQPNVADPTNHPFLNKGIVIKYNGGGKYITTGKTAAIFQRICDKAGVPYQEYYNRSDIAGGSTLGQLAIRNMPLMGVDIGLPQLAMHSAYETGGNKDTDYLVSAMKQFYESRICEREGNISL